MRSLIESLLERSEPSKQEWQHLVKVFAQSKFAALEKAPPKVQEETYDLFMDKLERLQLSYPDFDTDSRIFWSRLEREATRYWRSMR